LGKYSSKFKAERQGMGVKKHAIKQLFLLFLDVLSIQPIDKFKGKTIHWPLLNCFGSKSVISGFDSKRYGVDEDLFPKNWIYLPIRMQGGKRNKNKHIFFIVLFVISLKVNHFFRLIYYVYYI
jgi:hypothetical protein